MFSGLRQNSLFYVLEKGESPVLKVGQVVSVSNPAPKFGQYGVPGYAQPMETIVDVSVRIDDDTKEFKQLPSNLSVAHFDDRGVVVADSREAMCSEVSAMLHTSKNVLDSVDYHKNVAESCGKILEQLDPQLAKEKEQEKKIDALEIKMSGMEGTLNSIQTMLSEALNKSSKSVKN